MAPQPARSERARVGPRLAGWGGRKFSGQVSAQVAVRILALSLEKGFHPLAGYRRQGA
ncbi:MAG: hypothetical protein WC091_20390 [Sulfuricellaceae bacterium]